MKLTQKFCESAPKGIYWDTQLPGFGLRVHARTRSFILFIRNSDKQKRQIVIGHIGDLTLNDARERAREIKKGKVETTAKPLAVAEACQLYLREWAIPRKRSWKKDKQHIEQHILPAFGNAPLESLKPLDAIRWHKSIVAPYAANRALETLSEVFSYHGKMCRVTCANPCRAVVPNPEEPRDRFLSLEELRRFIAAVDTLSPHLRAYFMLLLLTGCRKTEIKTLKWEYVNLADRTVTIPKENMKQKRKKVFGISNREREILLSLPRVSEFVFPSPVDPTKPFFGTQKAFEKVKKIAGLPDIRIHDLRRTKTSHLSMLGRTDAEVARTIGDTEATVRRHYIRHDIESLVRCAEDYASMIQ